MTTFDIRASLTSEPGFACQPSRQASIGKDLMRGFQISPIYVLPNTTASEMVDIIGFRDA